MASRLNRSLSLAFFALVIAGAAVAEILRPLRFGFVLQCLVGGYLVATFVASRRPVPVVLGYLLTAAYFFDSSFRGWEPALFLLAGVCLGLARPTSLINAPVSILPPRAPGGDT